MTIFLISFLCLFSFSIQPEEELYLIRIKGEITNLTTEKKLEPGDQIKLTDELSFEDNSDAILYSNRRGRLQLSKLKNEVKPSGELYYIVKENLLSIKKSAISRSNSITTAYNSNDFKNYFGEQYSISSIDYLKVDTKKYPLDKDHFFYFRYMYDGETINKRISFDEDSLFLNGSEIFSLNGRPIDLTGSLQMTLYYYEVRKEKSTMITTVNFIIIDSEQLLEEIGTLVKVLENYDMSKADLRTEIEEFTKNEYGNYCFTCFWQEVSEQ